MKARTILVADDDFDNRAILRDALSASGFSVVEAADGEEALALASKEKLDLIFLDISMPKISGLDVARRLRENTALRPTPIFAFTAHAFPEDEAKARNAGCDGYISKPCIPREVVQKVKDWFAFREDTYGKSAGR